MPNGGEIFVSPELRQSLESVIDAAQAMLRQDNDSDAVKRAAPIVFDLLHEARNELVSATVALNFCSVCGEDATSHIRNRFGDVACVCSDDACWTIAKTVDFWDDGWCATKLTANTHPDMSPAHNNLEDDSDHEEAGRPTKKLCPDTKSVAGVALGTPPNANDPSPATATEQQPDGDTDSSTDDSATQWAKLDAEDDARKDLPDSESE